jgi:hypothetical protein
MSREQDSSGSGQGTVTCPCEHGEDVFRRLNVIGAIRGSVVTVKCAHLWIQVPYFCVQLKRRAHDPWSIRGRFTELCSEHHSLCAAVGCTDVVHVTGLQPGMTRPAVWQAARHISVLCCLQLLQGMSCNLDLPFLELSAN